MWPNLKTAGLVGLGLLVQVASSCAAQQTEREGQGDMEITIPASMREEHAHIHDALVAATQVEGPVGEAAQDLAEVLHPHFVREEQIALPPLGLLGPLARGEYEPWMLDVLPMTDSLAAELPQMLREHEAIGAAAVRLERVAREEEAEDVERLAQTLQLHARSEEEVFYPAAILVGEIVRVRSQQAAGPR